MSGVLNVGEVVAAQARLRPDRIGAQDSRRALTFAQWNARACRLANALRGLGLVSGDRVGLLAYNRVEWLELYVALAKAGLVAVPINFRLVAPEIGYIAQHSGVKAMVVEDALAGPVESLRGELAIPEDAWILLGGEAGAGWTGYESLIERGVEREPGVRVAPQDPWALMYTSGTTGRPKGAIRSHHGSALISLVTALDLGFIADDRALLVMPMCHANSLYFAFTFTHLGATCIVDDRRGYDPEAFLANMAARRATFTSLVPTHFILMQGLPEATRNRHDTSHVRRLMISSAPARLDTKRAILEQFPNSGLYELYGSTEAGWVTLLRPAEQIEHLGSVGREWTGTGPVRMLDAGGREVPDGEVGELHSFTPYAFDGYLDDRAKTREAIRDDGYITVGDLARRDERGFIHLVDRRSNMIISGGENVYPSEIENLLGRYPGVKDVAVVGIPHPTWGESVLGVLVLHEGAQASEAEVLAWCRNRMAGYKRPRAIAFVAESEMPRTATGKIQHRVLRERFASGR